MENKKFVAFFLLLCGTPVLAINNYDDPQKLLSYMDQALTPELDILRITSKISLDDHLIFEFKMRGESLHAKQDKYIFYILHMVRLCTTHPGQQKWWEIVIMLKHTSHTEKDDHKELANRFTIQPTSDAFHA